MKNELLKIRNVNSGYGKLQVLWDITFDVDEGELVAIIGPNSAGKTTLLKLMLGLFRPQSGTIRIFGQSPRKASRHIGYMPENNPLYGEMRVDEYLRFRAELKGVPRKLRRRRIAECADRCGVDDVSHQIIRTLSKGYRQRVGLADALVSDPPILILDEPTEGLDPNQVRVVREMVRELGERRTVLLSTHILSEVEQICPRVIIISDGRIVEQGRTEELTRALDTCDRLALQTVGSGHAIRTALADIPGVTRVVWEERNDAEGPQGFLVEAARDAGLREKVLAVVRERGWPLVQLAERKPTLEDVFVQRTRTADVGEGAS